MRVLLKYIIPLTLLLLSVTSCYDTKDGDHVEPITIYEKVNGNWKIESLKQVDEIAKSTSQSPFEMTLTKEFDFSTFTIQLDVDDRNQPTTFKIGGSAPAFFIQEGYWKLNRDFPTTDGSTNNIELYESAIKNVKVGDLIISSIPSNKLEMELKFTRKDKGIPFVSYVYKLIPREESNNE